jgi:hypothetical protein
LISASLAICFFDEGADLIDSDGALAKKHSEEIGGQTARVMAVENRSELETLWRSGTCVVARANSIGEINLHQSTVVAPNAVRKRSPLCGWIAARHTLCSFTATHVLKES